MLVFFDKNNHIAISQVDILDFDNKKVPIQSTKTFVDNMQTYLNNDKHQFVEILFLVFTVLTTNIFFFFCFHCVLQ